MASVTKIRVGGVALPSPTDIQLSFEPIWSSSTGRSATTGEMLGAIVTEKRTVDITWRMLTLTEFNLIKTNLKTGFFNNFEKFDVDLSTQAESNKITLSKAYRSNITYDDKGKIGGTHYVDNVKLSVIEK